jgi:hypothetical protein
MRLLGVIFILVGLLACLSIVGAVIGIPLIIVGLVLDVVGGRRKTIITNVVNDTNTPTGAAPAHQMAASINMIPRDARAELGVATGADFRPPTLVVPSSLQITEPFAAGGASYDTAKWKALVEFGSEIADAAKRVESYGQRYIDQLAAAYLALNDKQYLATIVQKIVSRAQQGT